MGQPVDFCFCKRHHSICSPSGSLPCKRTQQGLDNGRNGRLFISRRGIQRERVACSSNRRDEEVQRNRVSVKSMLRSDIGMHSFPIRRIFLKSAGYSHLEVPCNEQSVQPYSWLSSGSLLVSLVDAVRDR